MTAEPSENGTEREEDEEAAITRTEGKSLLRAGNLSNVCLDLAFDLGMLGPNAIRAHGGLQEISRNCGF